MQRAFPLVVLVLMATVVAIFGWWLFHAEPQKDSKVVVSFQPVAFEALPGWQADSLSGFPDALARTCAHKPSGNADFMAAFASACASAPADPVALRPWLRDTWQAWKIAPGDGKLTGYFEPVYRGARSASDDYPVPLYKVPDDLVSARLSDFDDRLGKGWIRGRLKGRRLVPYDDRRAIREGALSGRDLELIWLADPVDAFFLHIQGSGRVALPDGSVAYVGYAGQNGHGYHAIGRDLIASGDVPRERMSMQAIRGWLAGNPEKADALMDRNPSYIFFTERKQPGAIGAEGVVLTPERSIAVDRRIWRFGLPFWIDAGPELQRLVMGQDTGGAIRGASRADLFLGPGDAAGDRAGRMNEPLVLWLLLPKGLAPQTALR